ncbi:hypothetical protein DUNSADRAFT_9115 [Dunaliella salina]|uniref:DUF1499 domain-containing protein n=1 Tax=Dunaliella salina TaxID=3046 RepID=A0ABQ7GI50_DUNSA|nr:hypothetical protein DUNSADRAFT_9115 [Dunaliella salina]|eukprot:KAF5834292.1 hypothetical protein DUNSADRAFT_9115 [Dunaliella salina]
MLLNKSPELSASTKASSVRQPPARANALVVRASKQQSEHAGLAEQAPAGVGRREMVLRSVNVGVIASLFTFGAVPRPNNLGVQDYGGGVKTLALCPSTPNCIATSEETNDPNHYVPPWTYSPQDGRGLKGPVSEEQAMSELVDVVKNLRPDNFEPRIIKQDKDYLYVEYQSPTFGFIDDVEFWFRPENARVEYRSASRIGESDGNINRKRIRAIRQELEKKGWVSTGF